MNNSAILKSELESLYLSGNSMSEIALSLKCSIHKVVYWMNKYGIKKRNRSEALYIKLNPNGDPFKIKTVISPAEKLLFGLGLGIYWGEGERVSKGKVRVANTDSNLIKVFRRFLIEICQVEISRIHYYLICYKDSDLNKVKLYWSKTLEISDKKFGKIVQITPRGKGSYRTKSQNGVCIIEISNIKLKNWLMQQLVKLKNMPT
jgi:hypothetical protein